jgi:hypothetical protein
MAEAARETGLPVTVTGEPGRDWVVAVEGSHLRATAVYAFRNGQTRYARGELAIDGEARPLADDMDELRRLWDEHENGIPAPPPELPAIEDPGSRPVPAPVRLFMDMIASKAGGRVELRAGISGDHWLLGFDLGHEGDGLRIVFTRDGSPDMANPVMVITGGEDRSAEASGDVSKALAIALAATRPAGQAPAAAPGTQQPGFRDQGTETRRMVVIRELCHDSSRSLTDSQDPRVMPQ